MARSRRAASNAPAPRLAWAASSALSARRSGSPVSATARCRNAAAAAGDRALRPAGRQFELVCHLLVGPGGRGSQMPRTTVRIGVPIRDLRQRQVGRPAVHTACGSVDGGASQRMAEVTPRPLSAVRPWRQPWRAAISSRVARAVAGASGRRPARPLLPATIVGRGPEEPVRRRAYVFSIRFEEIARFGYPEPSGQLRRRQAPRQLDQRERIAVCLRKDPVTDPLVQRNGTAEFSSARASPFTRPRTSWVGHMPQLSPGSRAANKVPPARPTTAERRRRASVPTSDPATARRRRRRAGDVARPLPKQD